MNQIKNFPKFIIQEKRALYYIHPNLLTLHSLPILPPFSRVRLLLSVKFSFASCGNTWKFFMSGGLKIKGLIIIFACGLTGLLAACLVLGLRCHMLPCFSHLLLLDSCIGASHRVMEYMGFRLHSLHVHYPFIHLSIYLSIYNTPMVGY